MGALYTSEVPGRGLLGIIQGEKEVKSNDEG